MMPGRERCEEMRHLQRFLRDVIMGKYPQEQVQAMVQVRHHGLIIEGVETLQNANFTCHRHDLGNQVTGKTS